MDHYTEPLPVGITIATRHGATAWGLATSAGHLIAEVMPDGIPHEDAFLAAFTTLVEHEELRGRPIYLYCASEILCQALAQMPQRFPQISVQPWTKMVTRGLLVRTAEKAARDAIGPQTTATGRPDDRLLAATDGSAGSRHRKGIAAISGWAWITTEGTYGHGTFDCGSILAAELYAIHQVVDATRSSTPLTVLTDSADAIEVIDALCAGASPASFDFPGHAKATPALRHLSDLLQRRDITITWVRGHAGNPLNEAADRLAVHARRAAQMQVPETVRDATASRIVAETMQTLTGTPIVGPKAA